MRSEEAIRLIRESKRLRREKRKIKFIGYMRRTGRRAKYVRVE